MKIYFPLQFSFSYFFLHFAYATMSIRSCMNQQKNKKIHTKKLLDGSKKTKRKKRFSFSVIFFLCWKSFGNLAGCTTKWHTFFDKMFFERSSKFSLRHQKYFPFKKYQFYFCIRYSCETFCNLRNIFWWLLTFWFLEHS